MNKDELYEVIYSFLKENGTDIENITIQPELSLLEQGIIDSMAMVALLLKIEQKNGIPIDFGTLDAKSVVTLEGLVQLFCNK